MIEEREKQERRRKSEFETEGKEEARTEPLIYPLSITLFVPSLAFSPVLIITRFCVTSLNKALPCLFHFLPASVRVTLQGLTIISSTDTDMLFFSF